MSVHTYELSNQTSELIEWLLKEASYSRSCRIHWGQIFPLCKEYIGAQEKQVIKKLADKWGVEIIGR